MSHHFHANPTRREALYGLGAGLGSIAFSSLLQAAGAKTIHHPAKAKRCIFLMMEGGPSHIDTFDPKPALEKYAIFCGRPGDVIYLRAILPNHR